MTAALDHPTHAISAGTRTVAAVARTVETLAMIVQALRNRRQVDRLSRLSDHELADIGLMRTDLEVVMRTPLGIDPTARLGRFARERHGVDNRARGVR